MSQEDLKELLEHFDIEEKRLNADMNVQAAWICHYFQQYELDYTIHKMPNDVFVRLWSASQVLRLQLQMDTALAVAALLDKKATKALQKNSKLLQTYQKQLK